MAASPTARTLAYLRKQGYTADVVERFLGPQQIRRDLFHCIDVVAVKAGAPILGVQATTAPNLAARLTKAKAQPELAAWLAAGGAFVAHGWARRNGRWYVRAIELRGEQMEAVPVVQLPRRRRRPRHRQGELF